MDLNNPLPDLGGEFYPLIQQLLGKLFDAEADRLDRNVANLVLENSHMMGRQTDCFVYEGDVYQPRNTPPGRKEKPMLHRHLEGEMLSHLKDARQVEYDKHQSAQILFKVICACKTEQELRNALPNCIVKHLPTIKDLPRTDEPGCVFPVGSRDRKQFDKIAPKLDIYSVGNLFF